MLIDLGSYWFEVPWIDTRWSSAKMVQLETRRDGSIEQFVDIAMGRNMLL